MKIAYLVAEFPKASETFVSREFLTLRKLGVELKPFAFTAPKQTNNFDAATRKLIDGVEYISNRNLVNFQALKPVFGRWKDNALLQAVCTQKSNPHMRLLRACRLAQELKTFGISHLHAHWPYATQVAYLVHQLTHIPFSISVHAHEVEYDNGHFPKLFESLSFATFCNRAAMDRLLLRMPASARERSHLVYHGVDLERFRPLPFPKETRPLRIVSAGRLTRSKGFDRLVRACAKFHALGGAVELTILGKGDIEAELKGLAERLNFSQHLHLPGWLPHDQVAAQLGEAHLFALMADTRFHDGLPNVVLEAMASARPVILSPLPAADEAVRDGVEGFILCSAEDEEGFVKALQQCVSTPDTLQAMGRAARQRMERSFDERIHTVRLKSLFEQHAAAPNLVTSKV